MTPPLDIGPSQDRPETIALLLTAVARYLDLTDVLLEQEGREVQADLDALAAHLRDNPDLDATLYATLPALTKEN